MNLLNSYEEFKEQCETLGDRFYKKYFSDADYVCHPHRSGLLLTPCSAEESRANTPDICRVADILLMSDDGQKWQAFDLSEARNIAAENGSVYITDLCGEASFEVFDWMINGKNDTIVVSIQYMKDKGKQYAPVTPLVNVILPFKKLQNPFFWQSDDDIIPSVLSFDGVKKWLESYSAKCAEDCPKLKFAEKVSFPLFDLSVVIDINTTRIKQVNRFFEHIGKITDDLKENSPFIEGAGIKFSIYDFITDLVVNALVSDGITIDRDKFVADFFTPVNRAGHDGDSDRLKTLAVTCADKHIDCIKLAYLDALTKLGGMDFDYGSDNSDKFLDEMHAIEQGDIEKSEEKFLLAALLSKRPANCSVFAYIEKRYPEEKSKLSALKEYWGFSDDTVTDLMDTVLSTYLDDSDTLPDGSFIMPIEKAQIVLESLTKVLKKYGFEKNDYISSLEKYISDFELRRRTSGGTVFATPEEAGNAEKFEKEAAQMCADLSALNRDELIRLRKFIHSMKISDAAKGKYLVKIRLALSDCDQNALRQMTLGLYAMKSEEAAELGKKVLEAGFDDVVSLPFIAKINDRIYSLKAYEFAQKFSGIDKMTPEELDNALVEIEAEKTADKSLVRHYKRKIVQARDRYYINLLKEVTADWENKDVDTLAELMGTISDTKKYPAKYADPFLNKIGYYIENYDKVQLSKLFEDVESADSEKLDLLFENASLYDDEITAPYMKKLEARRAAIEREEQNEQLYREISRIGEMSEDELEAFEKTLGEKRADFPDDEFQKINRDIEARFEKIEDEKLKSIEDSIPEMDLETANAAIETLTDGSIEPGKTAPLVKSLKNRIDELYVIELDKICDGMMQMERGELEDLKQKVAALSYPDVIKNRTLNQIERRISAVLEAQMEKMIGYLSALNEKEALDLIRRIQMMQTEEALKSRYIDKLEAHIIKLREEEALQYVAILEKGMKDGSITPAMLCIHGSALFPNKVEAATSAYASVGRFEQPIIVHDSANSDEAFLLTCEFLYFRTKAGAVNRVKVDDIEELKVKKALLSASVICKTRSETLELPQTLDKKNIEGIVKLIESVIFAIRESHTTERMKAVNEAAALAKAEEDFALAAPVNEEPSGQVPTCSDVTEPGGEAPAGTLEADKNSEEKAEEKSEEKVDEKAEEKPETAVKTPVSPVKIVKVVTETESPEKPEKALRTAEEITFDLDTISKGLAGLEDIAKELEQDITEKVENMPDEKTGTEAPADSIEPGGEPVPTGSADGEAPAGAIEADKNSEEKADGKADEKAEEKSEEKADDSDKRPKFCIECGAKVTSATAKFCAECGAKLGS
jgi:hypothetical protein